MHPSMVGILLVSLTVPGSMAHSPVHFLNNDSTVSIEPRAAARQCWDYTFTESKGIYKPIISECRELSDQAARGMLNISPWTGTTVGKAYTLVGLKSCAFGIAADCRCAVRVGSGDVAAIINEAIEKFTGSSDTWMAASGTMQCLGHESAGSPSQSVNWEIYINTP